MNPNGRFKGTLYNTEEEEEGGHQLILTKDNFATTAIRAAQHELPPKYFNHPYTFSLFIPPSLLPSNYFSAIQ